MGVLDPSGLATWIGDKMVGEKAKTFIEGHPEIIFHGFVKKIRVHLEDITPGPTYGTVYWHAKYELDKLRAPLQAMQGKSKLKAKQLPSDTETQVYDLEYQPFRKPCVPPNDPTVHKFDLRIYTDDGLYEDGRTPWGDLEGFDELGGPDAHIGF